MSEDVKLPSMWEQEFTIEMPGAKNLTLKLATVQKLFKTKSTTTIEECALFAMKCQQYGADPFMQDLHLIKYSDKEAATIVTGVGFFQKRAFQNPRFEGYGRTFWLSKQKGWVDCWVPSLHGRYPMACRASCHVKGYRELQEFTINWEENCKMVPEWVDGQRTNKKVVGKTWDGMPSRMMEKVAMVFQSRMRVLLARYSNGEDLRLFWGTFEDEKKNQLDMSKPKTQRLYYDDDGVYPRLQAIKKHIDPKDVFRTTFTVNNR